MLDRNCLTWTDLSEFVTFYKICQCSGALDNFIHCGNPPSQVPTEAKYCPDSGGWWVVGGRCPECVHRRPQLSTSCPCQQCRSFGSQRWREYVSDFLVGGGTLVHDRRFFGFFYLVGGKCLWCSGKCCLYFSHNHNPSPTPAKWEGLHF